MNTIPYWLNSQIPTLFCQLLPFVCQMLTLTKVTPAKENHLHTTAESSIQSGTRIWVFYRDLPDCANLVTDGGRYSPGQVPDVSEFLCRHQQMGVATSTGKQRFWDQDHHFPISLRLWPRQHWVHKGLCTPKATEPLSWDQQPCRSPPEPLANGSWCGSEVPSLLRWKL